MSDRKGDFHARNPVQERNQQHPLDGTFATGDPGFVPAPTDCAARCARDLDHRRHHLRLHQAAPDGVVSGHHLDPGQERGLGDEAAPPSGYLLQRRVADQTQADAGDDGARPRARSAGGSSSTTPISVASEAAASAVVARPARRPLSPPSRPSRGHPLRMKLTVVEGFRLTEIAAWAQLHLGTALGSSPMGWPAFMASPRPAAFMSRWWWVAEKPLSSAPSFDG